MTEIHIRQLCGDEIPAIMYYVVSTYAFNPPPPLPPKEERREILSQRRDDTVFALFEDGVAVSCAAGAPMTQHVRSAIYPMGGIWGVATDPASRRRGYSRQVLTRLLAALREAKIPLACLHPFREGFYKGSDCDLSIQALSALIYGTHDAADFAFRDRGNPLAQVQERMRSLFSPMLPYIHQFF